MTSDEYAQILDDFELNAPGDVMPGESLTEYIERRRREFESKADGGSIGIEVLFKEKMANGGRVPMVSGGALKGLMNLFKGGDKAADLVKQEEIFRSGDITADFLEKVDPKVTEKFIRTRDTSGVGGYGMYDNFADMPNGLKAAELIKTIKTKDGRINYEAAELFIGKKLKGDETIDELIKMVITEKKADGGRVGLFMGGDPLTGQALQIYNSMKGYNFSDQEIADALSARGLYTPGGTTTTPSPDQGIIGIDIQDRGGGRETTGFGDFGNLDPNTAKTFTKDVFTIDKNAKPGDPITGSFQPKEITGYKNINTGNYQTIEGKNINHGGIPIKPAFAAVLEGLGFGTIDETDLTGLPYKEGYIAGTFTGKNPIDLFTNQQKFFKTQTETIADINAKIAAEAKRKETLAKIQAQGKMDYNPNIHGPTDYGKDSKGNQSFDSGMGFGIGSDGGPVSNRTGRGRTGYSEGGLATMFTRRR